MRVKFVGAENSWYFADICRAAAGRHSIEPLNYGQIASTVASTRNAGPQVRNCAQCDAAIIRSMPAGSLEQVIFRMDALAELEASGVYLLNPPRAMEAAIDKYVSTARLSRAGLATPPTHVSQHWRDALDGFDALERDVVLKPLFGGEGRGITRITDVELAERAFKMLTQMGAVVYQQKFIEHNHGDLRILMLGDKMWGMRRRNADDWRANVSRGAIAEPVDVCSTLADLTRQAADAVGAVFAGVDILEANDGNRYVLEVNAVPGWKALSTTLQVDIAAEVLTFLERAVRRGD